jgi:hypothetical protein
MFSNYTGAERHPQMKTILRAAEEYDKPFLRWLEEACMREYAIALWGTWRPRPEKEDALDGTWIIVDDGVDVGCVATTRHADLDRQAVYCASPPETGFGSGYFTNRHF